MTKVLELFGAPAVLRDDQANFPESGQIAQLPPSARVLAKDTWIARVNEQRCPFLEQRCYKVRKSDPENSIGTCMVSYGKKPKPILICPARLLQRNQIFVDCIHLLTTHEPGNELHVVSEVSVPGGSVDHFLVSSRRGKVKDFVGIELQTLDTTGTVWPERQRLLKQLRVPRNDDAENSRKPFGINWKMTAKTILVQMHHKIKTFEHLNRKLVLVMQDCLLDYMRKEFDFSYLKDPGILGDSMHFHTYHVVNEKDNSFGIVLDSRCSTDSDGISTCLGLKAEARIELAELLDSLERRISDDTLLSPIQTL